MSKLIVNQLQTTDGLTTIDVSDIARESSIGSVTKTIDDVMSVSSLSFTEGQLVIARTRGGSVLGGGTFRYTASALTADNGVVFSAGSGFLVRQGFSSTLPNSPVNICWWGAVGDGSTDCTTAITSAISFVKAASKGGSVYIPSGNHVFSSTINVTSTEAKPLSIVGDGKASSKLVYAGSSTTIDLLYAETSNYLSIEGVGIKSNTTMTAGNAIHLKWAGWNTLKDVAIGSQSEAPSNIKLWNGIYFESTDFSILDDYLIFTKNRGLLVAGAGMSQSTYPQYDLWVNNGKISYCSVGVHLAGGFDNFYIDNSMITYNGINIVIDNAMYTQPNQISGFGPHCIIEYAQTGANIYINDTLATYPHSQITIAGHVSHGFSDGIAIASWPGSVITVKSPFLALNAQYGINVADNSVKLDIAPECSIVGSLYGIFAQSSTFYCMLPNRVVDNTTAKYNANVVPLNTVEGLATPSYAVFTPAGSSTSDATVLNKEYVLVNSNSATTTGVRLPSNWVGKNITIYNVSTTAFLVYPSTGAQINASGSNVGVSLAAGGSVKLYCASTTQWLK